jgi:excisionase family DNA binding protein
MSSVASAKEYVRPKEAAVLLSVSLSTVNRMLRDEQLRRFKARGCVLIPVEEIERIKDGRRI